MATSHDDIVRRWVKEIQTDKGAGYRRPSGSNVFYDGDKIYSWGFHFIMAQVIRDEDGAIDFVLVNGDVYSVSTSRHQRYVRNALIGIKSVIIPFSSLEAAGVQRDSVRIVDRSEDSWITEVSWRDDLPEDAYLHSSEYGGAWLSAQPRLIPGVQVWAFGHSSWAQRIDDGSVRVIRARHVLGASLVTANVWAAGGTKRVTLLSGFDMNETRRSYFLCQLPTTAQPTTVAEAYEALKPEVVKQAEQAGRNVMRQGDIFAIDTGLTKRELTKMGATYEKRGRVFGTNHVATDLATLPSGVVLARGTLTHAPKFRAPDHKRVTLPDRRWYICVKNTVPVAKNVRADRHRAA